MRVTIDISDKLLAKIDAMAEAQKRARKGQIEIMLEGLVTPILGEFKPSKVNIPGATTAAQLDSYQGVPIAPVPPPAREVNYETGQGINPPPQPSKQVMSRIVRHNMQVTMPGLTLETLEEGQLALKREANIFPAEEYNRLTKAYEERIAQLG